MCSPWGFSLLLANCLNLYQRPFKRADEIQSDTINRYFAYTWQTCKIRMRMLACQPCEWECCHAKIFLAGSGGVLNQRTNHSTKPQKCSNVSWIFWTPPSHSGSHAQHCTSQVADEYTKSSSAGKSCQLLSTDTQWSLEWALPGCMEGVGEAWLCGTCHLLRAVSYVPCTLTRWPMTRPNTSKHFQSYFFKYINSHTLYCVLYRCEYYTCIYMCIPLDIYYVLIYYASITCWCNLFGFH